MTDHQQEAYRLTDLAELASELGLHRRLVNDDRLDVVVAPDTVLCFCNLAGENDTLVGFDGTPWHAHGVVQLMTGAGTYGEYDELDIMVGLGSGELVIVSQYLGGELRDRWLAHRDEGPDLRYLAAGEELRIRRVGEGSADGADPGPRERGGA